MVWLLCYERENTCLMHIIALKNECESNISDSYIKSTSRKYIVKQFYQNIHRIFKQTSRFGTQIAICTWISISILYVLQLLLPPKLITKPKRTPREFSLCPSHIFPHCLRLPLHRLPRSLFKLRRTKLFRQIPPALEIFAWS